MILLDSDHVSVLIDPRHSLRTRLLERLDAATDNIGLPIVVVEEHLRGWMAAIHRARDVHRQMVPYLRLAKLIDFVGHWPMIQWNEPAADFYLQMRSSKLRLGTQDLKIGAIAMANDALLLSANLRDFERIPRLRVEDWLRE